MNTINFNNGEDNLMHPIIGIVILLIIYGLITKVWIKIVDSLHDGIVYYFRKILRLINKK